MSDEAEKGCTGEAEEDVPKRTVIDDGSAKPNGIAKTHGPLTQGSVQLELPMSSNGEPEDEHLAERARAIVDSLDKLSSEEVFAAFEELDQLPKDVVRAALEGATGPAPDPEQLDDAVRRAHGFPERALRLRRVAVTKDADIFDLGPVAEQQLRLAGKAWDGRDLEPEERLDGEVEDSFAGTLEHHILADADVPGGPPIFDVLLYAGDAGTIFRAGTTHVVGAIAYGVVEMKDRRSRAAIQDVLARPVEIEPSVSEGGEPGPVTVEPASAEPVTVEPASAEPASVEPARLESTSGVERLPSSGPLEEPVPMSDLSSRATEDRSSSAVEPTPTRKRAAASKKKAATAPKKAAASKTGASSKKAAASAKKAASAAKKAAPPAKKAPKKRTAAAEAPTKKGAKKGPSKKTATKKAAAKKTARKPADD